TRLPAWPPRAWPAPPREARVRRPRSRSSVLEPGPTPRSTKRRPATGRKSISWNGLSSKRGTDLELEPLNSIVWLGADRQGVAQLERGHPRGSAQAHGRRRAQRAAGHVVVLGPDVAGVHEQEQAQALVLVGAGHRDVELVVDIHLLGA